MAVNIEAASMQIEANDTARAVTDLDPIAKINRICKAVALAAAIGAGATGLYLQLHKARFGGLVVPAAMEQAQIAAHLARGEGMTTDVVTPLGLHFAPSIVNHPEMASKPLYAYLLSLAFRVRGPSGGTVAICNAVIYLLTIAALYALSKALFGKGTAILTAVLYAASIEPLDQGLRGESIGLAGLLLTLTLLVLYLVIGREWGGTPGADVNGVDAAARRPAVWKWLGVVGAGVLFALTYLSGHVSLLLLAPLALMVWFGVRKGKAAAALVFVLVTVACLVPWFHYNQQHTGSYLPPLQVRDIMRGTQDYPGSTVLRQVSEQPLDPITFAIANPRQMGLKVLKHLTHTYRRLPLFISLALFPFLIVGAFWAKDSRESRAIWRVVIAAGVIQIVTASLYVSPISAAVVLAPVAVCLATGAFVKLLGATVRSRSTRVALTGLLIAIVAFPYAATVSIGRTKNTYPSAVSLGWMRQAVHTPGHGDPALVGKKIIPEDAVIATNDPWAVAWYTGRTAVWLPPDDKGLLELQRRGAGIDYVYLSRAGLQYGDEAGPGYWELLALRPDQEQIAKLGTLSTDLYQGTGEILIELHHQ